MNFQTTPKHGTAPTPSLAPSSHYFPLSLSLSCIIIITIITNITIIIIITMVIFRQPQSTGPPLPPPSRSVHRHSSHVNSVRVSSRLESIIINNNINNIVIIIINIMMIIADTGKWRISQTASHHKEQQGDTMMIELGNMLILTLMHCNAMMMLMLLTQ